MIYSEMGTDDSPSESTAMHLMDCLVKRLVSKAQRGISIRDEVMALKQQLPCFLSYYHTDHSYSVSLESVFRCHAAVCGLSTLPTYAESEAIARLVFADFSSPLVRRRYADRRYEMAQKHANLIAYIEYLFHQNKRLLVVRVDLGYRKEFQHEATIARVYADLDWWLQAKNTGQGVFENCVGCAWVLEQGQQKGYHIHVALFFDGDKRRSDWVVGNAVGDVWQQATNGIGTFHNCSSDKARYREQGCLGIGLFKSSDPDACEAVLGAVRYLTNVDKEDQVLLAKPKGRRTFGTGQIRG